MRTRKRKQKAVPSESDSESEHEKLKNESDSDSDVPEGINDLMNLPIELLRKELINRKFQPTVIDNLPKWQLSAMLRESTASSYESFFYKIMGYSVYWSLQNKPAFNKKSFDEFRQQKDGNATEDEGEEEEESSETEVDAKEFKKTRRKSAAKTQEDTQNTLNPNNYQQKYINGQFKYYPNTLIADKIQKREVPPEYIPPEVIDIVQTTEIPEIEKESEQNKAVNDIVDNPNSIPVAINTQLLNYGVLQSSIDNLDHEQVQKIIDDSKSKDFDVFSLIEKYNLKTAQARVLLDSQFSDSQTQKSEENTDSDDDSSDDSSDSDSSNKNSDEANDEDDHMNERY